MAIVAHEEQRKALEAAKGLKIRIEYEMKKLETQLDELTMKQESTDGFISMLEEDLGVEESPSVGDIARDLARRHPDLLVTSKRVTQVVTENGFGTEGAVHAFFSRTTEFERVGRGEYRMRSKDRTEGEGADAPPEKDGHSQTPLKSSKRTAADLLNNPVE